MSASAEANVRAAASSIEGVPAEFAGYIAQAIRRIGIRSLTADVSVLGAACDGGWASLVIDDLKATGLVCAVWDTQGRRPLWAESFSRPPKSGRHGSVLDSNGWLYQRTLGSVNNPRLLRGAVTELLLASQTVFGILQPWMWYLNLAPFGSQLLDGNSPDAQVMVDLRSLGNGGITIPPPAPKFVGCSEEGAICHELGECEWHSPCEGLRGCGTSVRRSSPCSGCGGIGTLLTH